MERLQRMLASGGMGGGASPPSDSPQVDTAEQIYISSLALIKMLKHGVFYRNLNIHPWSDLKYYPAGRAGVPMEVMGLMLGEFVDDYTVKVGAIQFFYQTGPGFLFRPLVQWNPLMLSHMAVTHTRLQVVDVFAMPQSGTGVSVEAVDPVFQTKMLDMLKQCGRWRWLWPDGTTRCPFVSFQANPVTSSSYSY